MIAIALLKNEGRILDDEAFPTFNNELYLKY
jgi:hypothetical protein